MSWRSASFYLLALVAACSSSNEPQQSLPAFTRDQLLDPTNCKDCHPQHYAEWSSSMHAYATKDPVFQAMNKRGQEMTSGALGKFCVQCHAPMAVADNKITDYANLESLPEQYQGITCYFCHNAVDTGPEHFNGNIKLANDTTMRAALDRAQIPSVHKVQYSTFHERTRPESAQMCGTCHDIVNTFNAHNYPLEQTYSEWQQTYFALPNSGFQSCQTCHMDATDEDRPAAIKSGYPGVPTSARRPHSHLFPGVDVALTPWPNMAAMQSAIEECQLRNNVNYLQVELEPPTARFTVAFETQAGHGQPSGATQDRRMWMEVVGKDATGKVIYQDGQIADGAVEETPDKPHRCIMRTYTLDDQGKETHNFWEAAKKDEMRSQPIPVPKMAQAGSHTRVCSFPAPGLEPIPHLEFTLKMRPMGIDVLNDLVATGHLQQDVIAHMPTHTVWTRTATYDPTTRRYLVDAANPDCDKYKCMLDPSSTVHCRTGSAAAGAPATSMSVAGAPATRQLPASSGAAGAP